MDSRWVKILRDTGYPDTVVVLDFETFFDSDYSLKKYSTIEYIQSDQFEILGVASLEMTGKQPHPEPVAKFWPDVDAYLRRLQDTYGEHLERVTVVAHNSRFDVGVLTYRYGCRPPYVVDTLGLARHVAARKRNGLAQLCERHGLIGKGDTDEFKGLHRDTMTDAQWKNLAAYAENDAMREWELFTILLPQLTRPEIELRLMQHTLTMFTRPMFTFDFNRATVIQEEMKETEAKIVGASGFARKDVSGTISFERILREVLGDEEPPMKPGKLKPLVAVAQTDPGYEYLQHHEKPEVRALMAAKIAIKTWPKNIKRVDRMVAQAKAAGGFLAAPLKYYGAHTGRWAGDEKINLQNLTARSLHACINAMRGLLTAPPGYILVVADAAQIEARNLAWQAGQDDLVEAFVQGRQIYCEFAGEVMDKRIRKPLPFDPPEVVSYLKHYRMFGKVGILGCGYGMGAARCLAYARDVYHLDIDPEMAMKIVKHYRGKYKKICTLWTQVEKAFKFVLRYPHEICHVEPGLSFANVEGTVVVTLPSGRALYYHAPFITKDEKGRDQLCMPDERKIGAMIHMWGGYLVENIIQATSRDILAEAILELEARGYPVALTAHDEVIAVVPEDQGENVLRQSIEILSQTPIWMAGCPLSAEGGITRRYGKG